MTKYFKYFIATLFLLVGLSTSLFAFDFPSIPNTFVARDLISASKMMANFNALKNGIIDGTKKINVAEVYVNGTRVIENDTDIVTTKATIDSVVIDSNTIDNSSATRDIVIEGVTFNAQVISNVATLNAKQASFNYSTSADNDYGIATTITNTAGGQTVYGHKVQVNDGVGSAGLPIGIDVDVNQTINSTGGSKGINVVNNTSRNGGASAVSFYGVYSLMENTDGDTATNLKYYGVYGESISPTPNSGTVSYGLYGKGTGAATNYGVYSDGKAKVVVSTATDNDYGIDTQVTNTAGGQTVYGHKVQVNDGVGSAGLPIGIDVDVNQTINSTEGSKGINVVNNTSRNGGAAAVSFYGVYSLMENTDGDTATNLKYYGVYGESISPTPNSGTVSYGLYGKGTGAATNYGVYSDGDMYVTATCSALAFVDRTPYPKDKEEAYSSVLSMERVASGNYFGVNHKKLNKFIKSTKGNRNLSATVSAQNEVIKDLIARIEEIEGALSL